MSILEGLLPGVVNLKLATLLGVLLVSESCVPGFTGEDFDGVLRMPLPRKPTRLGVAGMCFGLNETLLFGDMSSESSVEFFLGVVVDTLDISVNEEGTRC